MLPLSFGHGIPRLSLGMTGFSNEEPRVEAGSCVRHLSFIRISSFPELRSPLFFGTLYNAGRDEALRYFRAYVG